MASTSRDLRSPARTVFVALALSLAACSDGGGDPGDTYDPGVWTKEPAGVTQWLRGVWGTAQDDVWAVGMGGVALHYDYMLEAM